MTTITIPSNIFKALCVCRADDKEVRYYLRGLFLDAETQCVVATDGHRLLRYTLPADAGRITESRIIPVPGKLPGARVVDVQVAMDGARVRYDYADGQVVYVDISAELREARYPVYARIIPEGPAVPVECIGVNARYLADVAKALLGSKNMAISMVFRGANTAIEVSFGHGDTYAGVTYIVMPMRM